MLTNIIGAERLEALRADLRVGFVDDRFTIHYLPTVRIADHAVVGLQAAIQWDYPGVQPLRADLFLAAAALEGREDDALRFVLAQTGEDVLELRAAGLSPGPVSIPVPPARLVDGTLVADIIALLGFSGIAPEFFSLDIPEHAFAPPMLASTSAAVTRLSDAGFRLAVCAFGTGGASLAVLRSLTIDELKIDPGLLVGLGEDPVAEDVVHSIVALGRTLAVGVVAPGITTVEQLAVATAAGCDFAQGPLIARPLDLAACMRWLEEAKQVHIGRLAQATRAAAEGDDASGSPQA